MTDSLDKLVSELESPQAPQAHTVPMGAIGDAYSDHHTARLACPASAVLAYRKPEPDDSANRGWRWVIEPIRQASQAESDWLKLSAIPANEGYYARNLREARCLHAARLSRGAPAHMIAQALAGIEGATMIIQQAHAAQQAPQQSAPKVRLMDAMSPTVRILCIASMLAFFGVNSYHLVASGGPRDLPSPRVEIPGAGYVMMRDNMTATGPLVSYSAPFTELRYNSKGRLTSTTFHPAKLEK